MQIADLLTVDPHTPTPEPVRYDKKDGQWYTHDGVDVKETQQRKGVVSFINLLYCNLQDLKESLNSYVHERIISLLEFL